MRRGTRVGQAYVDLVINGDNANNEIADAFDGLDGQTRNAQGRFEKSQKAAAKQQAEDAAKQIRESARNIEGAIKNDDAIRTHITQQIDKAFDDGQYKDIVREMGDKLGINAGSSLHETMVASFRRTLLQLAEEARGERDISFTVRRDDGLTLPNENFRRAVVDARRAVDEMIKEQDRLTRETMREIEKRNKAELAAAKEVQREIEKRARAEAAAAKQRIRDAEKQGKIEVAAARQELKDIERAERERIAADRRAQISLERISRIRAKFENDRDRGVVDERGNAVSRNRRGRTAIADRIGGLFGEGSRNNALNLLGKSIGGVLRLTERAREAATPFFKAFVEGFEAAGENATKLQKVMSGLSSLGSKGGSSLASLGEGLAASGPAAAAAVVVLIGALSGLISIVGALIGLVTALAATIAGALVASLTVAAAAFGTVLVGAGLLTAAFMSMTDAQKAMLTQGFLPVRQAMVGIGQLIFQEFTKPLYDNKNAITIWSENLQRAILLLQPFASAVGKAFAQAGVILTSALSGVGFQQLSQALGTYLPSIILRLSATMGNFLNGTAALFATLLPYVLRFSTYLQQVTARFMAWATSASGQNAIVNFVDRALASLKSLWNATKEVFGFISDLLFSPQAMAAGNTIFDGIARTFQKFRKSLAEAAANGDLQRWFNDAIEFGTQLWAVIEALGGAFTAFYNSGALDAVSTALGYLAQIIDFTSTVITPLVNALGWLESAIANFPNVVGAALGPLGSMISMVVRLGQAAAWAIDKLGGGGKAGGIIDGKVFSGIGDKIQNTINFNKMFSGFKLSSLKGIGGGALKGTSGKGGGSGLMEQYKNPYVDFANSLIKQAPSIATVIKNAIKSLNKQIIEAIKEANKAAGATDAKNILQDQVTAIRESAKQTVDNARSALESAAQTLASASDKDSAKDALKKVKSLQKDLAKAIKNQTLLNKAADKLKAQKYYNLDRVKNLLAGLKVANATLGDYARARESITKGLDKANDKLADAISLRDDYRDTVTQSLQDFGNLLTAQVQTIDGVEQALTAGDITSNLQDRLAKIKAFQDNLRILLAQGLSNAAYKQLVDAGVDASAPFVQALIAGGAGATQQLNGLVDQIDTISKSLGLETSNRMYQAGVDAAQGLVDGLNSLSDKLDSAAAKLGDKIASSLKKSLGIKSPSRVLIEMMDSVGDGAVIGLNNQHGKVGTAASQLADQVAIVPGASSAADRAGGYDTSGGPVSGNQPDPRFRDLIVNTPTEDPQAVAHEVLNEVVGRL